MIEVCVGIGFGLLLAIVIVAILAKMGIIELSSILIERYQVACNKNRDLEYQLETALAEIDVLQNVARQDAVKAEIIDFYKQEIERYRNEKQTLEAQLIGLVLKEK